MNFLRLSEFEKELKALLRKYPTLENDIKTLEKLLRTNPRGYPPAIVPISNLGIETEVFKVKHFRCRALNKGCRSGIRIVYAYLEEKSQIEYIEMYFKEKGDTECDKSRILKYYPRANSAQSAT